MKTLIILGSKRDWEAYLKFCKNKKLFEKSDINPICLTYWKLFNGGLKKNKSEEIIVFPFFPYYYWDTSIESKNYKGTYGNYDFYLKFRQYWKWVEAKINNFYYDKKISYINHPKYCATDRDKVLTKQLLKKAKISVPRDIRSRKISEIKKLIKKTNLFIKVRCGAMGKGITYLTKESWLTNFRFRNNRIHSRKSDKGWTFIDKTNNNKFLKELLKKDIIIEPEIKSLLIDGEKFDLRLYCNRNKVYYIYPRANNRNAITTNISQGAIGKSQDFLKKIPKQMLKSAKKTSIRAVKALNLDFAGVDIIFNKRTKKPVVLEVNCFPGFPGPKKFNLSEKIINEIIKKYDNAIRK